MRQDLVAASFVRHNQLSSEDGFVAAKPVTQVCPSLTIGNAVWRIPTYA